MTLLGGREGQGQPDEGGYAAPARASAPARQAAPAPAAKKPASGFEDMDDDIPF
jgi:single-strand DNA-binding protein